MDPSERRWTAPWPAESIPLQALPSFQRLEVAERPRSARPQGLINWGWFHDHRQGVRSWFSSGLVHGIFVMLLTTLWMAPDRDPSGVFLSGRAERRDDRQLTPVQIETSRSPQLDGGPRQLAGEREQETVTQRFPEPAVDSATERVAKPTPEAVADVAEEVIEADINDTRESLPVLEHAEHSEVPVEQPIQIAAGGVLDTPAEAIPSHQGVQFFGLESAGSQFVFIVDCSWSMTGLRWERATQELLDAIQSMKEEQAFYVMFFDVTTHRMFDVKHPETDFAKATDENLQRLKEWIPHIKMGYETDPADAVGIAIDLKPDAVFLLSDGQFNPLTQEAVLRLKAKQIVVHTVSLHGPSELPMLRQISLETGGAHTHVADPTPPAGVFSRERGDGSDVHAIHALVARGTEFEVDDAGRIVGVTYQGGDDGLRHLRGLVNLKRLALVTNRVSPDGYRQLATMPEVNELFLMGEEFDDSALRQVAALKHLRTLGVPRDLDDEGLAALRGLTGLKTLLLDDSKISDVGLRSLAFFPELEALSLMNTELFGGGLKHLRHLTKLRHLSLTGTKISDDVLRHLEPLQQLRSLQLTGTGISEQAVPHLAKLKNLVQVDIETSQWSPRARRQLKELEFTTDDGR